jgi:hypothetical protein
LRLSLALGLQWAAETESSFAYLSRSGSAESRALMETRGCSGRDLRARPEESELTYALQENGSGTQHECWI